MIKVKLDVMLAKRGVSSGELADAIGITQANLSILKTNKGKAVRFSTLDAICKKLDCTVGDILEYVEDKCWRGLIKAILTKAALWRRGRIWLTKGQDIRLP